MTARTRWSRGFRAPSCWRTASCQPYATWAPAGEAWRATAARAATRPAARRRANGDDVRPGCRILMGKEELLPYRAYPVSEQSADPTRLADDVTNRNPEAGEAGRIRRVDYVILYVVDLQRSIEWYRDVVGLPFRMEGDGYAEFATEGCKFALYERAKLSELIGRDAT